MYTCFEEENVSSGSITRDTDGLDRKEGLKYGGQTVVNPLLLSNSLNISLSALLGGGNTAAPSAADTNNNNFNNVIANLLSNALSNETSSQASDAATNEKIKSALYQAAAMLLITGGINNAAVQDTSVTAKDTVVSTIMQNNNLTPAQQQIFLSALKSAAAAIVSSSAPSALSQDTSEAAVPVQANPSNVQPSNNAPSFTQAVQQAQKAQAPVQVAQLKSAGNILNTILSSGGSYSINNNVNNNIVTPAQNQPVISPAVTVQAAVADITPAGIAVSTGNTPALQQTSGSLGTSAANNTAAQLKEIQNLAAALTNIVVNQAQAAGGTTAAPAQQPAIVSQLNKLSVDISSALQLISSFLSQATSESAGSAKFITSLKAMLNNITAEFNAVMASAAAMQIIPARQAATAALNNGSAENITAAGASTQGTSNLSTLSGFSQGSFGQGGNSGIQITSSNQPQFSDIAAKIAALLKEMNGNIQVVSKIEYTAAKTAAVVPDTNSPENNNGLQDVAPAAIAPAQPPFITNIAIQQQAVQAPQGLDLQPAPRLQQSIQQEASQLQQSIQSQDTQQKTAAALINNDNNTVSTADNDAVIAQAVIPAVIFKAPAGSAGTAVVSNSISSAASVSSFSAQTLTPVAVSAAAQLLSNDSAKYQPENTSKNFIQDINWVANNIIKPAITTDVAADTAPDQLFASVASFAKTVRDQVVLKQVVMNLNDSQPVKVDEIHMTLKPDNLGTITIKIEHSDNQIKGSITVSNNDVKDILKAGLPELKNTLNNLGIKTDSLDVTVSDGNANAFDRGSNGQYKEWEGAVAPVTVNDFNDGADIYSGANGYLNYLA